MRIQRNWHRCGHCGKRHWLYIPVKHWWYYLTHKGPLRLSRRSEETVAVLSAGDNFPHTGKAVTEKRTTYTGITNYHRTGWAIYCHNCWPIYLKLVEHDDGR